MDIARDLPPPGTLLIPLDAIRVPAEHRGLQEPAVEGLARSIEAEGLLQPIGIRADDAAGDGYTLVFGGHRLAACRRLGRAAIEAKVLDIDPGDADAAMHAENLFRHELDHEARLAATAAWAAHYRRRLPDSFGRAAMSRAASDQHAARRGDGETPDPTGADAAPADPPPGPRADPPVRALARMTGKSERVAGRHLKAAENLTAGQRSALIGRQIGIDRIARVAAIADPVRRDEAVTSIVAGMDADAAICLAKAPANATLEIVANPDADGDKPESEMTDDEWFDCYCGKTAARMAYREVYKADAILWRTIRAARIEFKDRTKGALCQSKVGIKGAFHHAVTRVVNVAHPKDWPACGPCGGSGACGNNSRCANCQGRAYALKTEAA
jgi:ParB-like chromosome segregation protein Spo0J